MKHKKELDQFFTDPDVAQMCFQILTETTGKHQRYMEPSAGNGALLAPLENISNCEIYAYDIDPKADGIVNQDFLTVSQKVDCVFANPPFGRRSRLAVEFFNHACTLSDIIGFIVPVQFRKWSVQSKLDKNMALISDTLLKPDSFVFDGKPYTVRCCFQIWVKRGHEISRDYNDMRLVNAPILKHPDFELWQYNNTKAALKVFDNGFDFAVPRQGYQDYSRRELNAGDCEKNKQWILIKAKNKKVLKNLWDIDYESLAMLNTTTPGFGKADLINHYIEKYGI